MAKEYLLKSLPGSFETNEATVGSFVSIPQFGLKPDLYQTYRTDLGALGAAQVATESARFFDPTHLLIVVAGPKTVETDDGKGGKVTVDVVKELQALGYEFVAI
jgi:predicted Zn-dependent peptidase